MPLKDALKRLFTRNVIIKHIPGGRLKAYDVNKSQSIGSPTVYQNKPRWRNSKAFHTSAGSGFGISNEEIEAMRRQMYLDFELMDQDALISSALDLVAEEASSKDFHTNEVLVIKSDDVRLKKLLHNLFYDVMNIEFNLYSWIRTMVKYGDMFLYLQVAEEYGIVNVMPIHPSLVRREEGTRDNPDIIKFYYEGDYGTHHTSLNTFDVYEIGHFRLLGDFNHLPYGRSWIDAARKNFKSMCIPGDAKVWTPNGYILMQDITVGQDVITYNIDTNVFESSKVKNFINNGNKEVFEVTTSHRKFRATSDHLVLTADGYKRVDELTSVTDVVTSAAHKNDRLYNALNFGSILERVQNIKYVGKKIVYDLETESANHNFVVAGVVVHNCLMEDSMMLNRIMRAPERRLFYIDVGNIAPEEIDGYIEQIVNETKKIPYIDPETGEYNLRFNIQPIAWYSNIPLLDGRTVTIKQLADEYESGITNWVYSIDTNNSNSVVPGRVTWCGLTKQDSELVRITLNDGSYVDFEPSHPVMLRNGSYKLAKDLVVDEPLMPFYTEISTEKNISGYEKIYNPGTQMYEFTHRLVASSLNIDNYANTSNVVHHVDFHKKNNSPENLDCSMTYSEHIAFHTKNASEMWNSKTIDEQNEINKKRSDSHKKRFADGAVPWSLGLTKADHAGLAIMADKMTKENNPDRADKISKALTGRKRPEHSEWMKNNYVPYVRTPEHIAMLRDRRTGVANPTRGKTWEEIYGIEKAEQLRAAAVICGRETYSPRTEEVIKFMREYMHTENIERWKNPEYKQRVSEAMKDKFDDYIFQHIENIIVADSTMTMQRLVSEMNNIPGLYEYYLKLNKNRKKPTEFKYLTIKRAIRNRGYKHFFDFKIALLHNANSEYKNHTVSKIEFLTELQDVYCMTVDKYHNFAIDSHMGGVRDGIFVKNSSLEDIYMPVRGQNSSTKIETLPGLNNEGQLEDVKYLRQKMLSALKIPPAYLGFGEEGADTKASLSQIDVRFSKSIERIQKIFVSELYKIAIIHLYVQGFTGEDLLNFELELTNPSLIFERQKIDILTAKVDLVKSIKEDNLFSDQYIYENIFGMTEDEWKREIDAIAESAKYKFRIQQITDEGNDPKVSGKSFGTPHDIATMQVASKYEDGSNPESLKHLYTQDERENNEGKPDQYAGSFETRRDQDFGRDPVGRRENTKMEHREYNKLLKSLESKRKNVKKTLVEMTEDSLDIDMLNESRLIDDLD